VKRWVWGACAAATWACAGNPPAPGPEPEPSLARRHWDQVCLESDGGMPGIRVDEVFDTVGVGRALVSGPLRDAVLEGDGRGFGYIVHYRADGTPGVMGVWDGTPEDSATSLADAFLRPRVRRLPPLLKPEGYHARPERRSPTRLVLAPPIECLPHMNHREGEPPVGLPDTVRTWVGGVSSRFFPERSVIQVDITLDAWARVGEVAFVRGDFALLDEVRGIVSALTFDPALRNGKPVPWVLRQSFRFRTR